MLLMVCMGCSDWLDVNPRTEMKEEVLLSSEDGYKSALIGAYIQIASSSLYGKNTSFYFTDCLARYWISGSSFDFPFDNYLLDWDFKHQDVEPVVEEIWKAYYTCIAHLNEILQHIDGDEHLFTNDNYHLIKGEALGLRGFLHLELLRLFGPIPDEEAAGKLAVPYVEELTKDPNKLKTLTYARVIENIIRDLNAAEEELEADPIVIGGEPNDDWQKNRSYRFNYYAVKGAKARYYQWIGDKEKAARYAQEVIDSDHFRLANDNDYGKNGLNQPNLVMLSEHLFGVNNPDHQVVIDPFFNGESPRLTQNESDIQTAYENITGDIRNVKNRYWEMGTGEYWWIVDNHFMKYRDNADFKSTNTIPVLRLAEMYLILLENTDKKTAEPYFKKFLIARNVPTSWIEALDSPEALKERLEKEYRKEFWGEGQLFFFYKRYAYKEYSWPSPFKVPDPTYEIPRPQSQTVFD